ncbi:acyltransferase domain-containing protein [Pseudonocardia sp. HH130630-07]|uniref:acyltransferase domain-containing protein n=1 Tax=Pseudonocardia sp. HH130630-07 TaxID=1690815 RepID=UPI0008151DD3|nr:acyltransferase domain-containing protein [Pseudonocardia sp. HH130630-07]ANY08848.1 hypothetical protein AFB00_24210 [Pseudonocardia sp. HH130630-07]
MTAAATAPVRDWLATLTGDDPRSALAWDPGPLPAAQARDRLGPLGVPEEDRAAVLATLPDPRHDPDRWRALCGCLRTLFSGPPGREPDWPDAPAGLGAAGRYFYVHLCLLALPAARDRQHGAGVTDDVADATFADVGAKMTMYRRAHGTGGFDRQRWVVRHLRGTLHRFGRLQFERARFAAAAVGGPAGPAGPADGDPVLAVHIPGDGPMRPGDCDDSFRAAHAAVAAEPPAARPRFATCSSWLLDDQLAEYLRPDSNIVDFQRRFTPVGRSAAGDADILEFVLDIPPGRAFPAHPPQDTALQRAIVGHRRAGRTWRVAHGWVPLGPAAGAGARFSSR